MKPNLTVLRITLDGEEKPNYVIQNACESVFGTVDTYYWQKDEKDLTLVNQTILEMVSNKSYDFVWLQIQKSGVIFTDTAKLISSICPCFYWTGDVRADLSDFKRLAPFLIPCFTNMTDVSNLRLSGYKSEYIQTGYDRVWYENLNLPREKGIIFCANHYQSYNFPLVFQRIMVVKALKKEFKEDFSLYGNGWQTVGIQSKGFLNNQQEAVEYNQHKIAINLSHFSYSRYFSDRLLREMSCGALVLSHEYPDYELDFKNNIDILIWKNIPELIEMCKNILSDTNYSEKYGKIAFAGMQNVNKNFTWERVLFDFSNDILPKYLMIKN